MISVKELHFTYPGSNRQTLNGLNFDVGAGEIFGFLGPSGAGKTTCQKIIIGILKNYSGKVDVMGQEARKIGAGFYDRIGVAFEFPNFYHKLTALENLKFFQSMFSNARQDIGHLLAMVGLQDDAKKRVGSFSKGMKMRLNFCRAFLNNPELIFLDEPTAGLDPANAKNIKNLILEEKREGKTIFLNTHDMTVADEVCDRVAFLVDGGIAAIDSPRDLKLSHGERTIRVEYLLGEDKSFEDFPLENLWQNNLFLDLLRDRTIETIHSQEATLEKVFLETTGKKLL